MEKIVIPKSVIILAISGQIAFWGCFPYFLVLRSFGDPRVLDDSLELSEMSFIEAAIFVYGVLAFGMLWFYAVHHAFSSRRFGWVAVCLFIWLSYSVYLIKFSKEES
ncbi:MAG: hypothetical protein AAF591_00525 [Verrucomicrobiota bacterium]